MAKNLLIGMAVGVLLLGAAGCSSVQKGSSLKRNALIGGGAGGIVGATAGHMTTLGGVPGGLIGLGLGATTGALMSESAYAEPGELPSQAEAEELSAKLKAREEEVARLRLAYEKEAAQRKALLEAHEKTRSELDQMRQQLQGNISISRDEDGAIKFTILSEVLFDSGKATLTSEGKRVLAEAADIIQKRYPDALVEVRGHTDNVPIRYSKYKSNWELSCARALAVVHYLMESQNFPPQQLMASGRADTAPVASNDTPEGRRQNRRAELIIRPSTQLVERASR